jgi:hypothetical protein
MDSIPNTKKKKKKEGREDGETGWKGERKGKKDILKSLWPMESKK